MSLEMPLIHCCRRRNIRKNPKRLPLDKVHIDYLTSQDTLTAWAGVPLTGRVKLFHRRFPNRIVSKSGLQRIYSKYSIKRRNVRQEKSMADSSLAKFVSNLN
jgi:hypothetical protein